MLAWERQPDESARAYEAFCLYRDMGPDRSLAKVGEMVGKSKAQMEKWSRRHGWVDRVRALEARDEMLRREAVEEHLGRQVEDHARREAELREKALEAREKAMDKALKMLQWPLSEQRVVREDDAGREQTLVFMPAKWSIGNAVNLYRMSVGDDPGEEDPDLVEWDFSELSEEEMEYYLDIVDKLGVKRPGP